MIGTQRQAILLGVVVASWFCATVAVICRFYARVITKARWQMNDYMMLGAYAAAVGLVVCGLIGIIKGELGVQITEIPKSELLRILPLHYKLVVADTIFMCTSAVLTNLSISHLYTTLFPHPWLFYTCRVQMALLVLFWLGTCIASLLICRPLTSLWDRTKSGQCFDIRIFWLGASIVSLAFDLSNLLLPMPILWGLKLERDKKLRLIVLFGLGSLICAVTAFRIHYDLKLDIHNITWSASPILLFSVPEPCLSIVAGCLPIMTPLFTRASSKVRNSGVRLSRTKFSTEPKSSFSQQLAPVRLSTSGQNAGFKRLPADLYPLSNAPATKDEEMGWATTQTGLEDIRKDKSGVHQTREVGWPDFGGIRVEQHVKVESTRA